LFARRFRRKKEARFNRRREQSGRTEKVNSQGQQGPQKRESQVPWEKKRGKTASGKQEGKKETVQETSCLPKEGKRKPPTNNSKRRRREQENLRGGKKDWGNWPKRV